MGGRGSSSGGDPRNKYGSKTNVPPELANVIGKRSKKLSIDDIIKGRRINPNYGFANMPYTRNCQRCVYAAEMARRGYDVEATAREGNATDKWASNWQHGFKGQTWASNLGNKNVTVEKNINGLLNQWGNGSRAIVYVKWKGVTFSIPEYSTKY